MGEVFEMYAPQEHQPHQEKIQGLLSIEAQLGFTENEAMRAIRETIATERPLTITAFLQEWTILAEQMIGLLPDGKERTNADMGKSIGQRRLLLEAGKEREWHEAMGEQIEIMECIPSYADIAQRLREILDQ